MFINNNMSRELSEHHYTEFVGSFEISIVTIVVDFGIILYLYQKFSFFPQDMVTDGLHVFLGFSYRYRPRPDLFFFFLRLSDLILERGR